MGQSAVVVDADQVGIGSAEAGIDLAEVGTDCSGIVVEETCQV